MPFEPLVTGAIETALNKLIQDDPRHQRQLERLKGRVIRVHAQELNKQLVFVFSHQVDVLSHYEGLTDCDLSLKLSVLPELKDQSNITRLIKQDKLMLEGDIQLAQKFSQLISDIKPDIEEWISRVTGDVVAHTFVQGAKSAQHWLTLHWQDRQQQVSQVITQEWQLAPSALELADFCDQIDDIKSQFSRLESRFDNLSRSLLSESKSSNQNPQSEFN